MGLDQFKMIRVYRQQSFGVRVSLRRCEELLIPAPDDGKDRSCDFAGQSGHRNWFTAEPCNCFAHRLAADDWGKALEYQFHIRRHLSANIKKG